MNMSKKFLFDNSFESEDPDRFNVAGGKKPAKPKYGEEDLEKARAEGFATGKETGEREARQAIEQQISQTLSAIDTQLAGLSRAQIQAGERQACEAVEAALTVVRKMFPRLADRHGLAEIESIVCDCLERLREEPRIVIRVSDTLLDEVEERVGLLAARAGFDGRIVFLSQEGLQADGVRVEWADGGAERDSDRLWREVDQAIARIIGPMQRPAEAAGPAPGTVPTNETTPEPTRAGPAAGGPVAAGAVASA